MYKTVNRYCLLEKNRKMINKNLKYKKRMKKILHIKI